MYATQLEDRTFVFGSSGFLFRNNKLMYDRETKSLWHSLTGEPVVGALAQSGIKLTVLPVVVSTWGQWKADQPETKVLSLDTGYRREYENQTEWERDGVLESVGSEFMVERLRDFLRDRKPAVSEVLRG